MKNRVKILFVAITALILASCDEPETSGIAEGVIRFPSIILNGESTIILQEGDPYNDDGAKAFLGTDDITDQLVTESTVDVNTPGVHTVTYTATIVNELGQESVATAQRIVVVAPSNPNTANDLSGTYARQVDKKPNGATAVWTKVVDGVYINNNVGGVIPPSVAILPVYVFYFDDNTILIPSQPVPNGYGTLSADITLTADGYTIKVFNFGFGTGVRTFLKQ